MATYYIRTDGNNANTGTTNSSGGAWRTLVYACAHTTSGDIIHVVAGTFLEVAQCDLAVEVSIEGDGATSIIKANFASTPLIYLASGSEGTDGNQHISGIKIDGNAKTGTQAVQIFGRKNVSIHDCTIVDFNNDGITFSGRTDFTDAPPTIYATGNTFYNNILTNCATYSGSGHGCLQIGGQDGMLIYGNTITQTGRSSGTNGWPIKYWDLGYLKGIKIYNNTITKEPFDNTTFDFAIEFFNVLGGMEIYGNTIVGSFDVNWAAKNSYTYAIDFHDNIVGDTYRHTNPEYGFYMEFDCSDVIIRSNTFRNLDLAIDFEARTSTIVTRISIYKNLLYNTKATFFNQADVSNTVSFFYFLNNTVYCDISLLRGMELPCGGTATNIYIQNNIIQGFTSEPIFGWLEQTGATIDTLSIQNNNFYLNGTNAPQYSGITPTNNTTTNNITTNPLFVGVGDYHLQNNSPCIDAGVNVGLPYNGAAPDMGAFELALLSCSIFGLRA